MNCLYKIFVFNLFFCAISSFSCDQNYQLRTHSFVDNGTKALIEINIAQNDNQLTLEKVILVNLNDNKITDEFSSVELLPKPQTNPTHRLKSLKELNKLFSGIFYEKKLKKHEAYYNSGSHLFYKNETINKNIIVSRYFYPVQSSIMAPSKLNEIAINKQKTYGIALSGYCSQHFSVIYLGKL